MAPIRVLQTPPPLPFATISFSTNGHTTGTTGNNVYSFGSSQLMEVCTAATRIPASAALWLSEKLYRTAWVKNPYFRAIKELAVDSSPSSINLLVILATYFDIYTRSAEIETVTTVDEIRAAGFHAKITTGFGFRILYSPSKFYRLNDHHASHHIFLYFNYVICAYSFINRDPEPIFSFDVFKLP